MKTSISLLSIYSIFLSWGAHMESRKLLSIVSFTGLPQDGFLSSPFQSIFFPSLKIISTLPCERLVISPPSPCKYWVPGNVPGAEAWRVSRSDQSPYFPQLLSWGESNHKQHTKCHRCASDCDASRKTKDARSKNHGSHSSEGWPKKARVRHLPKDFKGVFLPPMCEGESVAGHGKGTGLELKVFNVPREFQGGQQARASSKGRDYRLESRR